MGIAQTLTVTYMHNRHLSPLCIEVRAKTSLRLLAAFVAACSGRMSISPIDAPPPPFALQWCSGDGGGGSGLVACRAGDRGGRAAWTLRACI